MYVIHILYNYFCLTGCFLVIKTCIRYSNSLPMETFRIFYRWDSLPNVVTSNNVLLSKYGTDGYVLHIQQ